MRWRCSNTWRTRRWTCVAEAVVRAIVARPRKRRFSLSRRGPRGAPDNAATRPAGAPLAKARPMTPPLKTPHARVQGAPAPVHRRWRSACVDRPARCPHGVASQPVTRWLIAWNVGAVALRGARGAMMIRSSREHMRHRAQLQDDGKYAILALTVIAAIASLVAIACELAVVKDLHGWTRGAHVALAGLDGDVVVELHPDHVHAALRARLLPGGLPRPQAGPARSRTTPIPTTATSSTSPR